ALLAEVDGDAAAQPRVIAGGADRRDVVDVVAAPLAVPHVRPVGGRERAPVHLALEVGDDLAAALDRGAPELAPPREVDLRREHDRVRADLEAIAVLERAHPIRRGVIRPAGGQEPAIAHANQGAVERRDSTIAQHEVAARITPDRHPLLRELEPFAALATDAE